MKMQYCWRCRMEVPMLDEDEYSSIAALYDECRQAVKDYRRDHGTTLWETPVVDIFQPVREEYERLTGWQDMYHGAIIRHRLASFGPPCEQCGRPLRTAKAVFCAECGLVREDERQRSK